MQANDPLDFSDPVDPELLLEFADIDEADIDRAVDWFDENASEEWQGALEAPEYRGN